MIDLVVIIASICNIIEFAIKRIESICKTVRKKKMNK